MARHFEGAVLAAMTGAIDFPDDALSPQMLAGGFFYDADEFVAEDPAEAYVSLENFEVGVADARAQEADERLAGFRTGDGPFDDARLSIED
jgi:hypothetical protein